MDQQGSNRGGNLYNPRILQGNWYEDREQNTIGSNDGLRTASIDYKTAAETALPRAFETEVSVPAISNATGKAMAIDPASRYKRHPKPDTSRVIPDFGVQSNDRFVTTTQVMNNHKALDYRDSGHRPMVTAETFRNTLAQRRELLTQEENMKVSNHMEEDVGTKYWQTTSRSTFTGFPMEAQQHLQHDRAGFKYEEKVVSQALPFPEKVPNAKNQWGVPIDAFKGHPTEHHRRTTTRLFVDYRGQDAPRLGITNPEDGEGPPLPLESVKNETEKTTDFRRRNMMSQGVDNDRKGGYRIWQDYEGDN